MQARGLRAGSDGVNSLVELATEQQQRLIKHGVGNATWSGVPRIMSWQPMATVYDNFLSDEECDYLLKRSTAVMEPAMLVNSDLAIHRKSKARTSHGAFFHSYEDPVMAMITERIGHAARIPPGAPPPPPSHASIQAFLCHTARLGSSHQV